MEPDYSKYNYEELIQAFESIDREAYPEQFKQIQHHLKHIYDDDGNSYYRTGMPLPEEIKGVFENRIVFAILIGIFCFILGIFGTKSYYIDGDTTDLRLMFSPILLLVGPYVIWDVRKKWNNKKDDSVTLNTQGISYINKARPIEILWHDVKSVLFWRDRHYSSHLSVISCSDDGFSITMNHYGLNSSLVKEYIANKAQEYEFECSDDVLFLFKKSLVKRSKTE